MKTATNCFRIVEKKIRNTSRNETLSLKPRLNEDEIKIISSISLQGLRNLAYSMGESISKFILFSILILLIKVEQKKS